LRRATVLPERFDAGLREHDRQAGQASAPIWVGMA
jgi:hypothetical protein